MDIKTHRSKLYITDSNGYEVRLTVEEVADLVNYLKIHLRGGLHG